jgi:hypothetical protein
MAQEAYEQHKAQIGKLMRSIDVARWWQQYSDEQAREIWAGLYWLSRDPESPREVAKKAQELWEAFLQRQG